MESDNDYHDEESTKSASIQSLNLNSVYLDQSFQDSQPSISPREKLSYIDDRKYSKDINKFIFNHKFLFKLVSLMEQEVIKNKPDDIVEFILENIFSLEKISETKRFFLFLYFFISLFFKLAFTFKSKISKCVFNSPSFYLTINI